MKKYLIALLALLYAGTATAQTITVKPGDTVSLLARKYNTTVNDIVSLNGLADKNRIYIGQKLEVGNGVNGGDRLVGTTIPTVVALYEDSLASRISNSATSLTLVRGTDKQSRSLSGTYGFVVDEGTTSEEFMTATCAATACTITARGIDVQDGKTQVTALKFEHRRGASVKVTNFPQLAILSRILNGDESASSTFKYGDGNTVSSTQKCIKVDNGTTNLPKICYNESSSKFLLYNDGVNSYDLSAGGSGLSASTTKGIGITDSKIYVNASSTGGLEFSSDGTLQVKAGTGITVNSNGVSFNGGASNNAWSGNNTFTGRVNVSSTPANPMTVDYIVFASSTASSTFAGPIQVNNIGPNSGSTTTIRGNLQVNGNIDYTGNRYGATMSNNGATTKAINDTATITIAHGLGVIPSTVMINVESQLGTGSGGFGVGCHSFGTYSTFSNNQNSNFLCSVETGTGNGTATGGTSGNIINMSAAGSGTFTASAAVDATNITLTVSANTNTGGTRYIQWTAIR